MTQMVMVISHYKMGNAQHEEERQQEDLESREREEQEQLDNSPFSNIRCGRLQCCPISDIS